MPLPPAFDRFVAPARARPQIWRLLLGLVVMALTFAAALAAGAGVLAWTLGGAAAGTLLRRILEPVSPEGTVLLLASFVGLALAPVVAARLLHGRGAGSLFGPAGRTLRHFGLAAGLVAALYALSLLAWLTGFAPERNLAPELWLRLLPLGLVLVLIQTGAEEMVFRGYLMQQLAARFPHPAVYLVLPAALFGALHFDPLTMGANAWLVVASAALFGLAAADLTRLTGSLGAAWGLHFANNCVAILVIATQGTITGLALYVTPYSAAEVTVTAPLVLADLATLALLWAILRWRLGRGA